MAVEEAAAATITVQDQEQSQQDPQILNDESAAGGNSAVLCREVVQKIESKGLRGRVKRNSFAFYLDQSFEHTSPSFYSQVKSTHSSAAVTIDCED